MTTPTRPRGTVLTRWLVSLVGFAAATTVVVSSVLYGWYSHDSIRAYHDLAVKVLGQTARTLELLDESVKSTGFSLVRDTNVASMMAARVEMDLYGSAVRGILMQAMLSNPLIASIYLVNRRANLILGSPLPGNVNPRDYHRRIVALLGDQKENAIIRIDPHETPLVTDAASAVPLLSYVFFVGRQSDPEDSFLIINIRSGDVLARIIEISPMRGQQILVVTESGEVVFDQGDGFPATTAQTTALEPVLRGEVGTYDPLDFRIGRARALVAVLRSENLGYRFVSVTPYSLVLRSSLLLRNRTILLGVLIFAVGTLAATVLARRFYRPLGKLMQKYGGASPAETGDEYQILDHVLQTSSARSTSLEDFVTRNLPPIKQDYVDRLLDGRIELDSPGTRERLRELGVQFRHDMFQVLVLSLDRHAGKEAHLAALRQSALSAGPQIAGGDCDCEAADGRDGESVTLVLNYPRASRPSRAALENVVRLVQQRALRETESTVTVAIGKATDRGVQESCANARTLLGYRVKYGSGAILDDDAVARDVAGRDLFPEVEVKALLEAIRTLSRDRMKDCVREMFERFRSYAINDISRAILHALYATLQSIGDMVKGQELSIDADLFGVYERVGRSRSLAEMESELVSFYDGILQMLEARIRRAGNTHAHVMKTVVDFVSTHYPEATMSLETVAAQVRMNPTYLGKVFREHLGVHFTDYVTGLRLEKAKELLVGSTLTVAEIAFKVGFSSSSYFITCFRKQIGMTPAKYRNLKAAQGGSHG